VYVAAGGSQSALRALTSVFRLPLIYALALALLVHATGVELPSRLLDMGHLIGMAGPTVALVVLGIQLAGISVRSGEGRLVGAGIAAKLVVGPAAGIALAFALGAEGLPLQTLLIFACMPTAINALLLSVRFRTRPEVVGGIILGTSLLAPVAILAVLYWLGVG
jgi:predicted permease